MRLGVLLLALGACGGEPDEEPDGPRALDEALDEKPDGLRALEEALDEVGGIEFVDGPGVVPLRPRQEAPVEVVLLNDGEAPVVLDRSFGPLDPFRLHRAREATALVLDDADDAQTGGFIATCLCACSEAPCPECEPPQQVELTLAPGERYTASWSQQLRSHDADRDCYPRESVRPGRYWLSACAADGPCVTTEVGLPPDGPLELRWSSLAEAPGCQHLDLEATQRATRAFRGRLNRLLPERPVMSCAGTPRCVEASKLEAALAETAHPDCAALVVPRGDRMELYLHLPLPEGSVGGARFKQTWDLSGRRLLAAEYPQ